LIWEFFLLLPGLFYTISIQDTFQQTAQRFANNQKSQPLASIPYFYQLAFDPRDAEESKTQSRVPWKWQKLLKGEEKERIQAIEMMI
jgi:hypothetical protein